MKTRREWPRPLQRAEPSNVGVVRGKAVGRQTLIVTMSPGHHPSCPIVEVVEEWRTPSRKIMEYKTTTEKKSVWGRKRCTSLVMIRSVANYIPEDDGSTGSQNKLCQVTRAEGGTCL